MSISFPGESLEYRAARDRLLEQEAELRRVTEAVAAARRELPPGGVVPQDYVFQQAGPGGTPTEVRLSELFVRGLDTLVIYTARQFRGRRQGSIASHPGSCASARLAGAAVVVLGRHHLQPRLLRRGRGGRPKAHAECVPARRRSDPPLLGLRTPRCPDRTWAGPSPCRFHRPTVESVRLHAPGAWDRLVSGSELLLTAVVRPGRDF